MVLAFVFVALPAFAATNISTAADDLPQLRPPRAEIPPTFWERSSLWVIIGSVLLIMLIGLLVWILTRPKPPIIVPPHVRAKQALDPLLTRPEDGLVLSQVSQVLRHYIIEAFALPPGEHTTTEFCRLIARAESIDFELGLAISEFLHRCDERKFTLSPPAPSLAAAATAIKFVETAEARRTGLRHHTEQVPAA